MGWGAMGWGGGQRRWDKEVGEGVNEETRGSRHGFSATIYK